MAVPSDQQSFKAFERDGWHRRAPFYNDHAGRMTKDAVNPLLDALDVRPGVRLLDVCCGPGYVTAEAAARGAVAVGVDIAPAMVEDARARAPDAEFHIGDAEALDVEDASFDAVGCAFGLLHLPSPELAIAEAFRVLRPGGAYAFTVWDGPERATLLKIGMGAVLAHADMSVPMPPGPPIFQLAEREFTPAALSRIGFCDVTIQELPLVFRGSRAEEVWDFFEKSTVRTMGVVAQQIPEIQARIRVAVVEAASRYAGPGGVTIPSPALLFVARKPDGATG
ncbi:class I SAM-dependent methyltransferase [Sabulicella rubraurantiaca]|uniref:class I SAM-dependent methyltransferase n=1 Tax=Sabulicella rubraurantiaca TaxID=2811429 RepID=UPI001A97430C|nr:methyltransferase domain-containing protein [Sabulicella rubraurantiaca]